MKYPDSQRIVGDDPEVDVAASCPDSYDRFETQIQAVVIEGGCARRVVKSIGRLEAAGGGTQRATIGDQTSSASLEASPVSKRVDTRGDREMIEATR